MYTARKTGIAGGSYRRYTVGANFIRPQKIQWLMYIEACRGGYHPPAVYAAACGYSLCRGAATRRPLDASASPKIYLFISVVQHPLCLASPHNCSCAATPALTPSLPPYILPLRMLLSRSSRQTKKTSVCSHTEASFSVLFYFTCFILFPETRNACSEISIIGVSLTESV